MDVLLEMTTVSRSHHLLNILAVHMMVSINQELVRNFGLNWLHHSQSYIPTVRRWESMRDTLEIGAPGFSLSFQLSMTPQPYSFKHSRHTLTMTLTTVLFFHSVQKTCFLLQSHCFYLGVNCWFFISDFISCDFGQKGCKFIFHFTSFFPHYFTVCTLWVISCSDELCIIIVQNH